MESAPKLICDCMLGRLARWLRLAGFDTLYLSGIDDAALLREARRAGRVLLTRDVALAERAKGVQCVLLRQNDSMDQFSETLRALKIDPDHESLAARCPECNGVVEPVARESVRGRVPPYVYGTRSEFRRCSGCGRIYWRGTHRERIDATLEILLGGDERQED